MIIPILIALDFLILRNIFYMIGQKIPSEKSIVYHIQTNIVSYSANTTEGSDHRLKKKILKLFFKSWPKSKKSFDLCLVSRNGCLQIRN